MLKISPARADLSGRRSLADAADYRLDSEAVIEAMAELFLRP